MHYFCEMLQKLEKPPHQNPRWMHTFQVSWPKLAMRLPTALVLFFPELGFA